MSWTYTNHVTGVEKEPAGSRHCVVCWARKGTEYSPATWAQDLQRGQTDSLDGIEINARNLEQVSETLRAWSSHGGKEDIRSTGGGKTTVLDSNLHGIYMGFTWDSEAREVNTILAGLRAKQVHLSLGPAQSCDRNMHTGTHMCKIKSEKNSNQQINSNGSTCLQ